MSTEVSDAPAFVVIRPDGDWEYKPVSAQDEVDRLVTADTTRATRALPTLADRPGDTGRLRIWANDVMLLMPERFALNTTATGLIRALSSGTIDQTWRGVVAVVEYDRDPETGEVGFPQPMSMERREEIRQFLEAR